MQLIVTCNECIYPNNPECDWILSDIARTWSLFSPLHPCDWMAHCIVIWWRFNTAEKMPPCFQYVGENLDGKQNSKQSMNDQVVSLEFFFFFFLNTLLLLPPKHCARVQLLLLNTFTLDCEETINNITLGVQNLNTRAACTWCTR